MSVQIIEEYRAIAVQAKERADRAEAFLIALLLQLGWTDGEAKVIGDKNLQKVPQWGFRIKKLKTGAKLTLIKSQEVEDQS